MRPEYRLICRTIAALFFLSIAAHAQSFAPMFLSAGGPQYTDLQGNVWMPDYGFSRGTSTNSTTASISGTLAPEIYQFERYAPSFTYNFYVPNGTYIVDLRFAEIDFTSPGQRVFNITLNNQLVLSNFDIIAQAGCANCALDKAFTVQVTNGAMVIQLTGVTGDAKISGLEIVQQSTSTTSGSTTSGTQTTGTQTTGTQTTGTQTTGTQTTGTQTTGTQTTGSTTSTGTAGTNQSTGNNPSGSVLVNAGGGQYTDPQGMVWAADYGYSGTTATYSTTAPIPNTATPALYQKERYGANFIYKLPVATNGTYTVTLKFAELYWTSVGERVFSVAINSQWVLGNFDIIAAAGGPDRAIDEAFTVNVTNNVIVIQFLASVDNGKIDAIEIVPQTSTTQVSQPVNTPVSTPVQVSLSPSSTSLSAGGKSQFTAAVTGTSNTAVQWTLTPAVGSISSSGLYTAPSSVSTSQTVTVMATSMASSAQTASAAVSLIATPAAPLQPVAPPVTAITPSQAQLTASQTQQFTLTGLSSTQTTGGTQISVNWSISPSVGAISTSGLYTAPSSITTQQSVTVTATNAATSAVLGTASVALNPPPSPPSAPTGVTATAGNAQVTLSWTASTGATSYNVQRSTTSGGSYTTITTGVTATTYVDTSVANGTTYYYVINAVSTNGTSPNSTQASAQPTAPPPTQVTTIQLPVEVFGAAGTTVAVPFSIPSGSNVSGQLQLSLQIHGLKYQTEASVQVNGGTWMPINNTTVTLLGKAAAFGGIGGGFATLQLTMNLPAGSITTGQNTLTFQFNGTDGITSGFRVLNLNVLSANGTQLIPASSFTQDDPSAWQPPLNDTADIQAGQTLWKTAALSSPGFGPIQAHCGDCHTQDGRDLKYFNYSNLSIQTRAVFHGLTAQQGAQIASYIRSLNTPAPANARPWNPPYQPGPGLDSQPVTNWAAGAGLDAVIDNDPDMLANLMPNGSTASWAKTAYLNQRELPIDIQLLDWNRWLPTIHPLDAFGSQFANSELYQGYSQVRALLTPNSPAAYMNIYSPLGPYYQWHSSQNAFYAAVVQPSTSSAWSNPTYDREIYSLALWQTVKNWEINQEFGLEGMAQLYYGANAPSSRAWVTDQLFFTSPNRMDIPRPAPGIGNGGVDVFVYLSYAWYHTQLILNDGNGMAAGTWPIDWGYAISFVTNDLTWIPSPTNAPRTGTAGLLLEWLSKSLQAGPTVAGLLYTSPYFLVVDQVLPSVWSEVSSSQKVQLMTDWVSNWLAAAQTYTSQQLFTNIAGVSPDASTSFSSAPTNFTGYLVYALPVLQYEGVTPSLLNQVANWAAGFWPSFNWAATMNQTCTANSLNEVTCQ